jgi:hypothetical protein
MPLLWPPPRQAKQSLKLQRQPMHMTTLVWSKNQNSNRLEVCRFRSQPTAARREEMVKERGRRAP